MNDVSFVEVVETFENLPYKVPYEWLFKCTIIPQQGGHGSAGYVFQEDIQIFVFEG
jgi:hypothetical protein